MVVFSIALSALVAAHAAIASPVQSRSPYAVKEKHFVPRGWTQTERAPKNHMIDLQIGVRQSKFHELERHLYEVSDPDHSRYGNHLSAEEVSELVKPTDETWDLVHEWLTSHGITPSGYNGAKDWIKITLPVETVERLLDTEYHIFQHKNGARVARTSNWSLPRHLHDHIDTIQPTTSFFRAHPEIFDHVEAPVWVADSYSPPDNEIGKVCNISSVTPQCFETLYKTKGYKPQSIPKNQIGFTNYLGEHPIRTDAEKFLAKYRPEWVSVARDFKQITFANGPGDYPLTPEEAKKGTSKEANLDVQAIAGISAKTPITSYSTGGSPPFNPSQGTPENTNEPYLVWVQSVQGSKLPQIITTSYGDDEQTVPRSYAERVCKEFAQIGARGTSLLFSSGDSGVGDSDTCYSNDGKNTYKFLPSFPASCPFVTTIGATKEFSPEVVAYRPAFVGPDGVQRGNYTSGSGFSNYFETPKYQEKEVREYVKNLKGKYDGLYNKKGRGYPDISAQGLYFAYVWNGTEGVISGTSASCPLAGGILSLVNDALIAAGKPTLGFLNPWLYKKGYKAFTDVTIGSGVGCEVEGFPATKGWDPVTGFGTPNFLELVKLTGGKIGRPH